MQQHTKPIVHFFIKAPNLIQVCYNIQRTFLDMEALASVPMVAMATIYKMAAMEALTMLLSGTSELPMLPY